MFRDEPLSIKPASPRTPTGPIHAISLSANVESTAGFPPSAGLLIKINTLINIAYAKLWNYRPWCGRRTVTETLGFAPVASALILRSAVCRQELDPKSDELREASERGRT